MPSREICLRTALLFFVCVGIGQGEGPPAPPSGKVERVGPAEDGRIVVPTNQILRPAGKQIVFPGRPNDVALSPNGKYLAVLNRTEVFTLDVESGQTIDTHKIGGASFKGILFSKDGRELYVSTGPKSRRDKAPVSIPRFLVQTDGTLKPGEPINLLSDKPAGKDEILSADGITRYGANQLPAGMALSDDGRKLYITLNTSNRLIEVELADGKVIRSINVGNAPFDVTLAQGKAYVSNFAGRVPLKGDHTGPSGRAPRVKVDPVRNIASEGTLSVIDLETGKVTREIDVGLHPSSITKTPDAKHVLVANANSDTISVIDTATDSIVETISTRPDAKFLFGSSPNALTFSPDGKRLFVSNGTNNAIAVFDFQPGSSKLQGLIPTGWFPAGLVFDPQRNALYVANIKGIGSRDTSWKGKRVVKGEKVFGYNTHDVSGSLSLIPLPTDAELPQHTRTVLENNRQTEAISALSPPRAAAQPIPLPERHGEPSLFKHVLYIIKENRTYDQVFGDLPRGEADNRLCIYGKEVTPNHHKLVDEFLLLDNFYCSGILSADGHQWTDEAFTTDYLEKAFGGFPRSYPFDGDDALAYAPTGFLWDNVLAHHKTIRVYGEFVSATVKWKDPAKKERPKFLDCYKDFLAGNPHIEITGKATIATIEPHMCKSFIGFPSIVPDIYRAAEFKKELQHFEEQGTLPNFMIMLIPNDHTAGTTPGMPTPEAAVADNDLALGQIVEAVSKSRFWKETCIFVVQDDPQNGFDHVDGHRTVAMVISPYSRLGGKVVSTNYNHTSMVRTMELVLGLPPMNQFDSTATPMRDCFTSTPDFAPYQSVPNLIPLDRVNPALADINNPRQLHWAMKSLEEPLDEIDEADEDTLNRILWFAARGRDDTYPAWAINAAEDDDDDD